MKQQVVSRGQLVWASQAVLVGGATTLWGQRGAELRHERAGGVAPVGSSQVSASRLQTVACGQQCRRSLQHTACRGRRSVRVSRSYEGHAPLTGTPPLACGIGQQAQPPACVRQQVDRTGHDADSSHLASGAGEAGPTACRGEAGPTACHGEAGHTACRGEAGPLACHGVAVPAAASSQHTACGGGAAEPLSNNNNNNIIIILWRRGYLWQRAAGPGAVGQRAAGAAGGADHRAVAGNHGAWRTRRSSVNKNHDKMEARGREDALTVLQRRHGALSAGVDACAVGDVTVGAFGTTVEEIGAADGLEERRASSGRGTTWRPDTRLAGREQSGLVETLTLSLPLALLLSPSPSLSLPRPLSPPLLSPSPDAAVSLLSGAVSLAAPSALQTPCSRSHSVSGGQQCSWSLQHTACRRRNTPSEEEQRPPEEEQRPPDSFLAAG
ncbi:hypothetical protein EYF80_020837 [Liparis tanakae]|uniref:Uncharacterized protein n=1 Tax=Liparis tanakae TaxID=230148 RepID=A0A4Z2HSY8_9TELE|nr:hypothetical protein EYF80_020837 [Liparis tanakae]